MKLTIYNANAFKVKIQDGVEAYIEDHEHCALISPVGCDGYFPGQYYFPYKGATEFIFMVWEEGNLPKEYNCKILAYSHDYGKTWTEVKQFQTIDLPICYVNLIEDCLQAIKQHNLFALLSYDEDCIGDAQAHLEEVLEKFCAPLEEIGDDVKIIKEGGII